jgi:hypothetical protein
MYRRQAVVSAMVNRPVSRKEGAYFSYPPILKEADLMDTILVDASPVSFLVYKPCCKEFSRHAETTGNRWEGLVSLRRCIDSFNLVQGVNETGFMKTVLWVNGRLVKTTESEHRDNRKNKREHDKQ